MYLEKEQILAPNFDCHKYGHLQSISCVELFTVLFMLAKELVGSILDQRQTR